jgi:hypothetical protein
VDLITKHLQPQLQFLLEAHKRTVENPQSEETITFVRENFRLGECGFRPLLRLLESFQGLLAHQTDILSLEEEEVLTSLLNPYSDALLDIMNFLPKVHDRLFFDNIWVAKIRRALRDGKPCFMVCHPFSTGSWISSQAKFHI